jgi:hypothetical protein
MIILPLNVNNSNYTSNNDSKKLPISLFYIFLILIIYFILLFIIFMCALYSHRRRIGYNYEGLSEINTENEIEFSNDDGVKLLEDENDIFCDEEEIINEENFQIIDKQPTKNINSISNEIKFINQICDENILVNVEIDNEERNRVKKRNLFKNKFFNRVNKSKIYKKNYDYKESSKLEALLKNDDDSNRLLLAEDDV